MNFSFVIALLSAFAFSVFALVSAQTQYNLTYDTGYDDPNTSLSQVACSDGTNGLLTKGYTTYNSLPSYPEIGGMPGVSWNSPLCGTCWQLDYVTSGGQDESIYVTIIDAGDTLNVSEEAFNKLTVNNAALGHVTVTAIQVATSFCGM